MRSHRTLIPFVTLAVTLAANAAPVLYPLGAHASDTNILHMQHASPTQATSFEVSVALETNVEMNILRVVTWVNSASGSDAGVKNSVGLFSSESLSSDITLGKEKPLWPLSSYGPAKYEPVIVVGLDACPEELRVKAWEAKVQNNLNGYIQYEATQISQADNAFNNARNNIQTLYTQAIKQSSVVGSTTGASSSAFPSSSSSPFASSSLSNGAFGSQSAFGPSSVSTPLIFGASTNSNSVFGTSNSAPALATGSVNNGA
ncbi:MAG: hypothetical protein NXY57DRAFT_969944, partial [Lentinula lateritia]